MSNPPSFKQAVKIFNAFLEYYYDAKNNPDIYKAFVADERFKNAIEVLNTPQNRQKLANYLHTYMPGTTDDVLKQNLGFALREHNILQEKKPQIADHIQDAIHKQYNDILSDQGPKTAQDILLNAEEGLTINGIVVEYILDKDNNRAYINDELKEQAATAFALIEFAEGKLPPDLQHTKPLTPNTSMEEIRTSERYQYAIKAMTYTVEQRLDALITHYNDNVDDTEGIVDQEWIDVFVDQIDQGIKEHRFVQIDNKPPRMLREIAVLRHAILNGMPPDTILDPEMKAHPAWKQAHRVTHDGLDPKLKDLYDVAFDVIYNHTLNDFKNVNVDELSDEEIYGLIEEFLEGVKKGSENFFKEKYIPLNGPFHNRNDYMYCVLSKIVTIDERDTVIRDPSFLKKYKNILKSIQNGTQADYWRDQYDQEAQKRSSRSELEAKTEHDIMKRMGECYGVIDFISNDQESFEPFQRNASRLAFTETAQDVMHSSVVNSTDPAPSLQTNGLKPSTHNGTLS